MTRNPLSLPLLLAVLLSLTTPLFAESTVAAVAAQDRAERLQALQVVDQIGPLVLSGLLSYALGGLQAEVKAGIAADLAIDCPWVAGHIRTELVTGLKSNPTLATAALDWLRVNTPEIIPRLPEQITPELLVALAAAAPQTLDSFLRWLAGQSPDLIAQVARRVSRNAGGAVVDLLARAAWKYPRLAARAFGFMVRNCPQLLPGVLRLLRPSPVG